MDVDVGQLIQGGSGLVALYLAVQIKRVLDNHEVRLTSLEATRSSNRNASRNKRALAK